MNKKKLQDYRWLRLNMKKLEDRVLEIESSATKVTSTISDMPQGGAEQDKACAMVVKLSEAREKLLEKQLEALEGIIAIEKAIEKLDERGKLLVRLHYIEGMTWERVAVEMNYTWQHLHKIHRNVLEEINRR